MKDVCACLFLFTPGCISLLMYTLAAGEFVSVCELLNDRDGHGNCSFMLPDSREMPL
ncbi:MAG: hypothetical protein QOG71_478 [Pyrinomonadaceae bacterium]|nr:hypothetical protein [Pyrinomonadaceae bacterium]